MLCNRLVSCLIMVYLIPCFISCKSHNRNPGNEDTSSMEKDARQEQVTAPDNQLQVLKSDPGKEAAIQEAAFNGIGTTVEALIKEGINVNSMDVESRTALMYASFNGHTDIVRMLLDAGAEVGLRDAMARTALLYASTGPFPETVKLLLDHHSDPNIRDAEEQFTPLMHAAAEGQLEVVKILLDYGADPSLKDVDGENAEMFARNNGHTEIADLLKSK